MLLWEKKEPQSSNWIWTRAKDESGFALVLALVVVVALGTAVGSVSWHATTNFHDSVRSSANQTALALAEAGLNLAYSTLDQAPSPTLTSALPTSPVADIPMTGGSTSFSGTLNGSTWTLYGVGKAVDPQRPGQVIVRQVHRQAALGTGTIGSASNGAGSKSTPTPQTAARSSRTTRRSTSRCTCAGASASATPPRSRGRPSRSADASR